MVNNEQEYESRLPEHPRCHGDHEDEESRRHERRCGGDRHHDDDGASVHTRGEMRVPIQCSLVAFARLRVSECSCSAPGVVLGSWGVIQPSRSTAHVRLPTRTPATPACSTAAAERSHIFGHRDKQTHAKKAGKAPAVLFFLPCFP